MANDAQTKVKLLNFICSCDDPEKLRNMIKNARKNGAQDLEQAAFKRLIAIVPAEKPGTVQHDLWQTIVAFEEILTGERDKTTRLTRTRQKIARVGEIQTLIDWALGDKSAEGYKMLMERGLPELTGEAIVLRHPTSFEPHVLDAARRRLESDGVDLNKLKEPA
jgi:hypothetical protein